jgi:hypothetical protein
VELDAGAQAESISQPIVALLKLFRKVRDNLEVLIDRYDWGMHVLQHP